MSQPNIFDPQDVEKNKVYALLAYISILVLVPIFGAKESPYARFHANQGLVLLISSIGLGIAKGVIVLLFAILAYIPFVGQIMVIAAMIINLIAFALGVVIFAFMITGIINAAQGEAKELPFIGQFRILN